MLALLDVDELGHIGRREVVFVLESRDLLVGSDPPVAVGVDAHEHVALREVGAVQLAWRVRARAELEHDRGEAQALDGGAHGRPLRGEFVQRRTDEHPQALVGSADHRLSCPRHHHCALSASRRVLDRASASGSASAIASARLISAPARSPAGDLSGFLSRSACQRRFVHREPRDVEDSRGLPGGRGGHREGSRPPSFTAQRRDSAHALERICRTLDKCRRAESPRVRNHSCSAASTSTEHEEHRARLLPATTACACSGPRRPPAPIDAK